MSSHTLRSYWGLTAKTNMAVYDSQSSDPRALRVEAIVSQVRRLNIILQYKIGDYDISKLVIAIGCNPTQSSKMMRPDMEVSVMFEPDLSWLTPQNPKEATNTF